MFEQTDDATRVKVARRCAPVGANSSAIREPVSTHGQTRSHNPSSTTETRRTQRNATAGKPLCPSCLGGSIRFGGWIAPLRLGVLAFILPTRQACDDTATVCVGTVTPCQATVIGWNGTITAWDGSAAAWEASVATSGWTVTG